MVLGPGEPSISGSLPPGESLKAKVDDDDWEAQGYAWYADV